MFILCTDSLDQHQREVWGGGMGGRGREGDRDKIKRKEKVLVSMTMPLREYKNDPQELEFSRMHIVLVDDQC